ncbi:MAG: hypothetical protein AVDCRST_MAG56-4718, partial [uncultured Cytophagales bacterium]
CVPLAFRERLRRYLTWASKAGNMTKTGRPGCCRTFRVEVI